jgi:hypothetical protein
LRQNLYELTLCRKGVTQAGGLLRLVAEHFVFLSEFFVKMTSETKKDNAEISNKKKRIQFLSHFIKGFSTQ